MTKRALNVARKIELNWPLFGAQLLNIRALSGFLFATLISACGSEKDDDLRESQKDKEPQSEKKSLEEDQKRKPRIVIGPGSSDATAAEASQCAAPLLLQVVLAPEDTSGASTVLMAELPTSCFVNSTPVMRFRISSTIRLAVPLKCKSISVGDFNFECTGNVQPFVANNQVVLPISFSHEDNLGDFKGEIEFTPLSQPAAPETPTDTILKP
jgi:hypothetical protein